jgi:hypothetical protein
VIPSSTLRTSPTPLTTPPIRVSGVTWRWSDSACVTPQQGARFCGAWGGCAQGEGGPKFCYDCPKQRSSGKPSPTDDPRANPACILYQSNAQCQPLPEYNCYEGAQSCPQGYACKQIGDNWSGCYPNGCPGPQR